MINLLEKIIKMINFDKLTGDHVFFITILILVLIFAFAVILVNTNVK